MVVLVALIFAAVVASNPIAHHQPGLDTLGDAAARCGLKGYVTCCDKGEGLEGLVGDLFGNCSPLDLDILAQGRDYPIHEVCPGQLICCEENTMKVLTKEEEAEHYRIVTKGGLIGGGAGLALSVAGVAFASRRWPTSFGRLTVPFRAFLVTSAATFGAIVNADRVSIDHQRSQMPAAGFRDQSQRAAAAVAGEEPSYERFMEWGRENRYRIVFGSWLASMAVALGAVRRSPLGTAQKLVQARVYAQGLTLAVLIVSAVFEASDARQARGRWQTVMVPDPDDPEHKHMIEKRIHKEEFEGQDMWMDIVEAEEKRIARRDANKTSKTNNNSQTSSSEESSDKSSEKK